jgi:hypothetical protein
MHVIHNGLKAKISPELFLPSEQSHPKAHFEHRSTTGAMSKNVNCSIPLHQNRSYKKNRRVFSASDSGDGLGFVGNDGDDIF